MVPNFPGKQTDHSPGKSRPTRVRAPCRRRRELLDHVARRENLCLLVPRQIGTATWRHVFVADAPANDCVISNRSREANQVFPLWRFVGQDPPATGESIMIVAEQGVEQAKLAFNGYLQATKEAVSTFEDWVKANQAGAQGISKKAMSYAERNVLSAFEFAQKIVQANDIPELMRMQTEFVQSQIQVLTEQIKDLGETATKTAMESVKDLGETARAA
jgi:phasin